MHLSPHFTLEELTYSAKAEQLGIDNTPSARVVNNLKYVCEKILEPVRAHFGKPVKITSGYRNPVLNRAIGGSTSSQHCRGEAVDFEIMGISTLDLADWVSENTEFDQVILEFYVPAEGVNSGWVHASVSKIKNRKQKLVAFKNGSKTVYNPIQDFKPN